MREYGLIAVLFVLIRIVLQHVRPFVADTLFYDMHFLDVELLRHRLLESVWALHAQPPLFNLFLGLVLKASGGAYALVFAFLYKIMGLAVLWAAFALLRALDVDRRVALATTFALMVFPSMIQAETWLYYTYPVTLGLIVAGWALVRYLDSGRLLYFFVFTFALTAVVLLRSSFHVLVWMAPVLMWALGLARRHGLPRFSSAAAIALAGVVLAAVPYIRNARAYGQFSSSTWMGYSLKAVTAYVFYTHRDKLDRMIADGTVTPLAAIERFSSPETYEAYYHETPPRTGIEALDAPYKRWVNPANGFHAVNYNHPIFARASGEYARDAMRIFIRHPEAYAESVVNQAYLFFGFSPYRYFYDAGRFLNPRRDTVAHAIYDLAMVYVIPPVFAAAVVWILLYWRAALGRSWRSGAVPAAGFYGYALFTAVYVMMLSMLIELGEGNYLRIPIDPLLAVGLAGAGMSTWRKIVEGTRA